MVFIYLVCIFRVPNTLDSTPAGRAGGPERTKQNPLNQCRTPIRQALPLARQAAQTRPARRLFQRPDGHHPLDPLPAPQAQTQVFFLPQNDHICTRIEHVLHVSTIATTICKGLGSTWSSPRPWRSATTSATRPSATWAKRY